MKPKQVLFVVLAIIVGYLQVRLWFFPGGVREIWQLKTTIGKQNAENLALKKRNDELVFQIERLQKSDDAIESRARSELGMVKKGEVFYQIVKKDQ